jgi:hypothetical protein
VAIRENVLENGYVWREFSAEGNPTQKLFLD